MGKHGTTDRVKELERENLILKTRLKHLTNEIRVTKEEYETTTTKYFDIYSNLDKMVKERTRQLRDEVEQRERTADALAKEVEERKQAEEAQRETAQMLQLIIENIPQSVYWKDVNSVYLGCNRNFQRFASPDERRSIVGKTDFQLAWNEEESNALVKEDREVIKSRRGVFRQITPIHPSDGALSWIEASKVPLLNSKNDVVGVLGTFEDVTDRKQMEDALTRKDAILESISYASERFLKNPQWQSGFRSVLRRLGKAASADRVHVVRCHIDKRKKDGPLYWTHKYEWIEPSVKKKVDLVKFKKFPCSERGFDRWVDLLSRHRVIYGHDNEFPLEIGVFLAKQQIKSILVAPIFTNDEWWGFIGFDACFEEREWSVMEVDALNAAADILGASLVQSQMRKELNSLNADLEKRIEERLQDLVQEIEKRRKTELKLREAYDSIKSQKDFQTFLLDSIPIPVYYLDKNDRFTGVNRAMSEFIGMPPEKFIGKTATEINPKTNERQTRDLKTENKKLRDQGGRISREMSFLDMKGNKRDIILSKAAYHGTEHGESGLIGALVDITERKQAERESEARRQQLMQADKMVSLGILVAGVAHEINNPNNFVMMNAPILMKSWRSVEPILEEYRKSNGDFAVGGIPYSEMKDFIPTLFDGIKSGAERIKNIVHGLKDYARQDPGDVMIDVNLNQVVEDALTLLANMVKKSTSNFHRRLASPPPITVGSPQRIEQVVINVVQNACHALTDNSQEISVETRSNPDHERVEIIVEDKGKGIPANTLSHIMDPFFTTKRDSGGTGLGLSISAGIVQEHDGDLIINSTEGEGTTVTISLPAKKH